MTKHITNTHKLGTEDIEISEMDYYGNEELNVVDVFINNLGEWQFYMYSASNKNKSQFLKKISHMLLEDDQATGRISRTAHGRFLTFQETWKKLEP